MEKAANVSSVVSAACSVGGLLLQIMVALGVQLNGFVSALAETSRLWFPIAMFIFGISIGMSFNARKAKQAMEEMNAKMAAKDSVIAEKHTEEINTLNERHESEIRELNERHAKEIAELSRRLPDNEAKAVQSAKDADRRMRDAFRKLPYGQKSLVRFASEGRLTTSYEGLETMEDALGDDGRKFLTYDTTKDGARYILTDEAEDFFSRHEDLLESVDVPSLKDSEKSGAKQGKAPNPWGTKTVRREYNRIETGVDEATKERITLMAENNRLKKMVSELECGPSSNDRETAVAKYETPSIELVMGMRPYVAASVRKAYDRGECIPIKEIDQAAIDSIGSKDGLFEYKRFVGPFGHPLPPEKYGLTKEWRAFLDDPTNRKQLETIAGSFLR